MVRFPVRVWLLAMSALYSNCSPSVYVSVKWVEMLEMLGFIIVVFIIELKLQYLTLLCVNVCWWLLCWLNGNNLDYCKIYQEGAPSKQDHYSSLGMNTFI